MAIFPVNANGFVPIVAASQSVPPYTYTGGIKLDALNRVVIAG